MTARVLQSQGCGAMAATIAALLNVGPQHRALDRVGIGALCPGLFSVMAAAARWHASAKR